MNTIKHTTFLFRMGWMMLVIFVLAALVFSASPVQASGRVCPAPGTGMAGAWNMVHDATMLTIPMARNNPNGNAGMIRAVSNSACP